MVLLSCIRLESILFISEDYCHQPFLTTNELVFSEESENELSITYSANYGQDNLENNFIPAIQPSYKKALIIYNSRIKVKLIINRPTLKTLSRVILILHKNTISHLSSEEDYSMFG